MRRADMLRVGPLNAALTEVTESFAGLVLASGAGHWVSPLAFCRETSQNTFGSEAWVTPRFGLAPPPVSAGSGALNQLLRLTAEVGSWPSPFYLKRSASLARGVSYLQSLSLPSSG